MDDVINRDVPIAEENQTLTGRPAKNQFGEWSEELASRTDDAYSELDKKSHMSKKEREKRLKEMDEVVKEDLE